MSFIDFIKKINTFPVLIFSIIALCLFLYFFAFLFPFTNNAFIVAEIMPVAADVSGFVTNIYVKNGQAVKKGQPLFEVYKDPYLQTYNQVVADYKEAQAKITVLERQTDKNQMLLEAAQQEYRKINYEYTLKTNPQVNYAISKLEVKQLDYQNNELAKKVKALQAQLKVDDAEIEQQKYHISSLKAAVNNAKINLDLTTVRAYANGVVDNMYISTGAPVIQHQPLFSFINSDQIYIQANFNEIDLRHVHDGDNVYILPRVYLWSKVYHGVIVGNTWAANRQITASKTQMQTVTQNENNWIMLPQRLPVQIRITDYDSVNYPLSIGSSAYVYIKTKH